MYKRDTNYNWWKCNSNKTLGKNYCNDCVLDSRNGSAVSWNTMLIIGDYYYKLFPRYHPERVLTVICQTFAIGSMAILTYKEASTNTRKRNIIGYTLFCVSTLILIVLDLATSGQGGIGPYIGICVIVVAFGVATALVQGGVTGDLSFMSPEFVRSFIALRLMTKAVFGKSDDGERNGAILKYYRMKAASEGSQTVSADLAVVGIQTEQSQAGDALEAFLGHLVTLSIFPVFNVWDMISRYFPIVKCLRLPRRGLMVGILIQFLFIPAFYFTAKYGDQGWMILLTSFLSIFNGYLTVCVFTNAPKGYKGPEQNALGNMLTLCLHCGIFADAMLVMMVTFGCRVDGL
ncbi:Equilibrative nucleotide transporter 3 [Vitis vinifera]|uniref:Equilibrative nucleotide transporter 3 n=1 Tax=Vitis vinifera TaxID=29760 RepID=A0A438GVE4_VITVI|nr:Equilibrative nucleotide transporter 3 [Vitis vinifera]